MKKVIIPVIFVIVLSIVFLIYKNISLNNYRAKALDIGINKYLEFLWIVDGAFNKDNEDYLVNGISLSNDNKLFKCTYNNKKSNECLGDNFEEAFNNLFASNISYDNVYSDGLMYSWYTIDNGNYYFNNFDNCHVNRMDLNHKIEVTNIKNNELSYKVTFTDQDTKKVNTRDFILVLENNNWKIKRAFYHDKCGVKYYIY